MTRATRNLSLPLLALLAVALSFAPAEAQETGKEAIGSSGLFSRAVRVGDLLFLSGALGTVPGQGLAEGGVQAETRQAIQNMQGVLEQAGATLNDLVKCTVFLADMADYGPMNEVYREMIPSPKPARSAIGVNGLALSASVEIECIAAAPPR